MPDDERLRDGRKDPQMIERRSETIREKGRAAARQGFDRDECPYRGWQGGYRRLWLEGFDEIRGASSERPAG